ncbi:hypothetical protein ABPG72_022739 [Tetrahymena utriculariae]
MEIEEVNEQKQEQLLLQIQQQIQVYNENQQTLKQESKINLKVEGENNVFKQLMEGQKALQREQVRNKSIQIALKKNRFQIGDQKNDQQSIKQDDIMEDEQQQDEKRNFRQQYCEEQKIQVVEFAIKYSTNDAAKEYCIPFETIKSWRTIYNNNNKQLDDKRSNNKRPIKHPFLEDEVYKEIMRLRINKIPISLNKIREICLQVAIQQQNTTFKLSLCWLYKFFKRKQISLRKQTTGYEINPSELQNRTITFIKHLAENKFYNNYDLLINMDETPFFYGDNSMHTYDISGSKRVEIQQSKSNKEKISACITIGIDLKTNKPFKIVPFLIFKNKSKNPWTIKKLQQQQKDKCKITFSESGQITQEFLNYFSQFLEQSEYKIVINPFIDDYQLKLQDILFNQILLEPL